MPLVVCGEIREDPFYSAYPELQSLAGDLDLGRLLRFTGYVSDAELAALYSGARAVVLPSFDEGFCLPAAEAMACGAPVAASSAGALPETLGPAAVYFDPHDPKSIAAALEALIGSDEERERLRAAGLERAESYRWDEAAANAWRILTL